MKNDVRNACLQSKPGQWIFRSNEEVFGIDGKKRKKTKEKEERQARRRNRRNWELRKERTSQKGKKWADIMPRHLRYYTYHILCSRLWFQVSAAISHSTSSIAKHLTLILCCYFRLLLLDAAFFPWLRKRAKERDKAGYTGFGSAWFWEEPTERKKYIQREGVRKRESNEKNLNLTDANQNRRFLPFYSYLYNLSQITRNNNKS